MSFLRAIYHPCLTGNVFQNGFITEIKRYLTLNDLILVRLDNALASRLKDINDHVQVEILPINTSSTVQSRDDGSIGTITSSKCSNI